MGRVGLADFSKLSLTHPQPNTSARYSQAPQPATAKHPNPLQPNTSAHYSQTPQSATASPLTHLDGLAAVKQVLVADGAVALHTLLAALVTVEQAEAHARVAVHAVEKVHTQALPAPVCV